jgi:outer membrane lipoprotein carrier protein
MTGLLAAVLVCTGQALPSAAQAPSAEDVARALQAHYDTVRDFSADFVQAYQGGVLRQTVTERGRLIVKKPGMMRWEYQAPERKVLVSDGHKIYFHIEQDRQVIVNDAPEDDRAATAALFLSGKGNLLRDFTVAYGTIEEAPDDVTVLRLTPRRPEPEYDWLLLAIDPPTLQFRMLVQVDALGGRSTFTFANVKENVGIADNTFVFTMPRGVDVISGQ